MRMRRAARIDKLYVFWHNKMKSVLSNPPPTRMKPKVFHPKNPEVKTLSNYKDATPVSFWDSFPSNKNLEQGPPFILDPNKFLGTAEP